MTELTYRGEIAWYDISAERVDRDLKNLDGDIKVFFSSGGGDVFEGIEIHNLFKEYSKTKGKVEIVNTSLMASIAAFIYQSADVKTAYDNASVMIHKSWSLSIGNSDEMIKKAKLLDGIDSLQVNRYKSAMNKSEDEVKELMSAETWYMGKDALVESGMVDNIIDTQEDTDEVIAKTLYSKARENFVAKAEAENKKIDFEKAKASILACNNGKCPSTVVANAAVPTAQKSDKPAKQIQGENMTDKEIMASEPYSKLVASHEEQVKAMQSKMDEANASLKAMQEKVDAQEAWNKQLPEICAMAIERNVSKDTLVAMVTAGDVTKAKAAVADGMTSEGAFGATETEEDSVEEDNRKVFDDKAKALGITFIGGSK